MAFWLWRFRRILAGDTVDAGGTGTISPPALGWRSSPCRWRRLAVLKSKIGIYKCKDDLYIKYKSNSVTLLPIWLYLQLTLLHLLGSSIWPIYLQIWTPATGAVFISCHFLESKIEQRRIKSNNLHHLHFAERPLKAPSPQPPKMKLWWWLHVAPSEDRHPGRRNGWKLL